MSLVALARAVRPSVVKSLEPAETDDERVQVKAQLAQLDSIISKG